MMGKQYDFQIDENVSLAEVKSEIVEMVCQKEQCFFEGEEDKLLMWNAQSGEKLVQEKSAKENRLLTGSRILLA